MFCLRPLESIIDSFSPLCSLYSEVIWKKWLNREVMAASADDTKLFLVLKMNADCKGAGLEGCFVWPQWGFFLCSTFLNSYCVSLQHFLFRLTKACPFPLSHFIFATTILSLVLLCLELPLGFFCLFLSSQLEKKSTKKNVGWLLH